MCQPRTAQKSVPLLIDPATCRSGWPAVPGPPAVRPSFALHPEAPKKAATRQLKSLPGDQRDGSWERGIHGGSPKLAVWGGAVRSHLRAGVCPASPLLRCACLRGCAGGCAGGTAGARLQQWAGLCCGHSGCSQTPNSVQAETRVRELEEELRFQKGVGVGESASFRTGGHGGRTDDERR